MNKLITILLLVSTIYCSKEEMAITRQSPLTYDNAFCPEVGIWTKVGGVDTYFPLTTTNNITPGTSGLSAGVWCVATDEASFCPSDYIIKKEC